MIRRFMAGLVAALVAALLPVPASAASGDPVVVWVFGHSIPAGIGAPYGEGWVARWQQLHPGRETVRNYAVGGSVFDGGALVADQVRRALADNPGEVPDLVLVDAGTNDLVNHYAANMSQVYWAAIDIELLLQSRGTHATWLTVLPLGHCSSHPDGWLPALEERRQALNSWFRAMAGFGSFTVVDLDGVLHEDPTTHYVTAPWLLPDGLHPGSDAALLIAAAVARAT